MILELVNGRYSCSRNANRIPAGGSGTYSVTKGKIHSADENFWPDDFDWGLILSGTYDYTFDGTKLYITSGNKPFAIYRYELEKHDHGQPVYPH